MGLVGRRKTRPEKKKGKAIYLKLRNQKAGSKKEANGGSKTKNIKKLRT
jgi:hypothetical protein